MTIASMKANASQYADLWHSLMPDIAAPGDDQFLVWAGTYNEEQVSKGIIGAARKLRAMRNVSQTMTPDDVARYATSIMRNELMGRRRFQ